jgi:hypothetical protein
MQVQDTQLAHRQDQAHGAFFEERFIPLALGGLESIGRVRAGIG